MTTADERIINRLDRIAAAQGEGGAAFADITGEPTDNAALQAALAAKVPTSRTVNGQALSGNVTVAGLLLDTTGAPDNADGNDDDYALDKATKTIYGPKAAGVWPAGVVLGAGVEMLFKHYTDVSNALTDGTVETLRSDTIPANTLTVNGEKIVQVEIVFIASNLGGVFSFSKEFGNRQLWAGTIVSPLTTDHYIQIATTIYRTGVDSFRSFVSVLAFTGDGSTQGTGMVAAAFLERSGAWPNDWTGTHTLFLNAADTGGAVGEITHRLSTTTKQK